MLTCRSLQVGQTHSSAESECSVDTHSSPLTRINERLADILPTVSSPYIATSSPVSSSGLLASDTTSVQHFPRLSSSTTTSTDLGCPSQQEKVPRQVFKQSATGLPPKKARSPGHSPVKRPCSLGLIPPASSPHLVGRVPSPVPSQRLHASSSVPEQFSSSSPSSLQLHPRGDITERKRSLSVSDESERTQVGAVDPSLLTLSSGELIKGELRVIHIYIVAVCHCC